MVTDELYRILGYRSEDLLSLLYGGDPLPLEFLEETYSRRIVEGGRWMRPEERGETIPI